MKKSDFFKIANDADANQFYVFDGALVHRVYQSDMDVEALISLVEQMSDDDSDHMRFCAVLVPGLIEMAHEDQLFYKEGIKNEFAAWTAYSIFKFLSRCGAYKGMVSEPEIEKRWFGLAPDQWFIKLRVGESQARLDAKRR